MAINYNYAIKYSTSKIVSRAYREYATETAEAYGRLVGMVSQAVEYEFNQNANTVTVDQAVNEIIRQYGEYGYSLKSPVVLPTGAIRLGDLLKNIMQHNIKVDEAIDLEQNTPDSSIILYSEKGTVPCLIADVLTNLQNCYHAAVVDQGAAIAFDNGGSPSEMVSMLRDSVMSIFSNGYTDFSNTLNDTIDKIKSGMSVIDYVEGKLKSSGIDAAANNGSTFDTSEDYTFTGSSVASAQSWKAAAGQVTGALSKAVRVAAQAVKTAVTGIIKVGAKLFKKAVSKLRQIFVDPYDIEEINGTQGNNTVNGFHYQQKVNLSAETHASLITKLMKGPIHLDFIPCEMIMQLDEETSTGTIPDKVPAEWVLNDFKNFVYHGTDTLNTKFFAAIKYMYPQYDMREFADSDDYLFILNTLAGRTHTNLIDAICDVLAKSMSNFQTSDKQYLINNNQIWTLLNLFAYVCEVFENAGAVDPAPSGAFVANLLIKVKPINYYQSIGLIQSLGEQVEDPTHGDKYIYSLGNFIDALDHIKFYDGAHTSVERSEKDLYLDFVAGVQFSTALALILNYEAQGVSIETIRSTPFITTYSNDLYSIYGNVVEGNVTNADFFNLFTKFDVPVPNQQPTIIGAHIAFMLTSVFDYRTEHPFDYEFFPYSQNYADWFLPSFQLKTDQQNSDAFVDFVSKAVLVLVVATIATTAVVTLRKLSMKADLKQKAAELIASDKAVVGRFDKQDMKNLRKATKRAKALKTLTGGLTSTATQIGITDVFGSDVEPLVTLIRG